MSFSYVADNFSVVLGRTMVAFSLRTLFIVHVVALVIAPLVVLGLLGWVLLLNHKISCQSRHTTLYFAN